MSAPTIEEQTHLAEFRIRVNDILETEDQKKDSFLLRWLRARDLDLNQAENMLRTSLAWRRENKINSILNVPLDPYFEKEFPYYINGVDKKGQPVVVVPIGKWDLRKCVAQGKTEEYLQYINYCFEDVCRAIESINKTRDPDLYPITQFTAIMDWRGYSYMQFLSLKAVQNMLYTGVTYEAHYPEILFSTLFVNCPSFINLMLKLLKPILAAKTFAKIGVFGGNRKEWQQACLEIIDEEQLEGILKPLS